jgi:hypothetical protein
MIASSREEERAEAMLYRGRIPDGRDETTAYE